MLGLSLPVLAQSTSIEKYFEQYQEDARFSRVSVSSRMFDLFVDLELDNPEEQALVETISKLKGLKVLIGNAVPESRSVFKEMVKDPARNMDELLTVSEVDKEFRFYVIESGGKISELMMVGYENEQVMMMSLTGDIDLKEIAELSQKMDIQGFENFKNVKPE